MFAVTARQHTCDKTKLYANKNPKKMSFISYKRNMKPCLNRRVFYAPLVWCLKQSFYFSLSISVLLFQSFYFSVQGALVTNCQTRYRHLFLSIIVEFIFDGEKGKIEISLIAVRSPKLKESDKRKKIHIFKRFYQECENLLTIGKRPIMRYQSADCQLLKNGRLSTD